MCDWARTVDVKEGRQETNSAFYEKRGKLYSRWRALYSLAAVNGAK